uniref:Uncharacterized protein n=1 Tax=viral metagenome TaxID=1070528 RepID=A0A6M3J7Q7_9ZZZZ
MEILSVYPKDIHVKLELSSREINLILDFLDNCKIDYDGKTQLELANAVNYVKQEFFPKLNKLSEELKTEI